MFKTIKRIIITLFVITAITLIGVFFYSLNRTFYNDEDEVGNTSGNIYNGGLYSEKDGLIFFSNASDNGCLYVMTSELKNFKKLHIDKAVYINADENYVYYVRANNTREDNSGGILMFNNTGIYRINQNGKNIKAITNNPGAYLMLSGNYLYYQKYDVNNGLWLYREKIDMKDEKLLIKDAAIPARVDNNVLYYTGFSKDHNINTMNISSFTSMTNQEGNFAYPIWAGEYIYYLDLSDNYSINRMRRDGSDKELLVDARCSTYNITNSGRYIYYQVDSPDEGRICRLDLDTMETEKLMDGNYKQIHVTDNYVFFKAFDSSTTYIQSADGAIKLGTFNPPNLSKN